MTEPRESGGPGGLVRPEEAEWVLALQRREAWAWERLQSQSLDSVFSYVYLRCGRREDAEDLTAEVFAAAVASIDTFRGQAKVETWLIGIARRKLIDSVRRKQRRPEVLLSDLFHPFGGSARDASASSLEAEASPSEAPDAVVVQRETLAEVRRLVLQLPEAQREALWLRCVHQLSLAETAVILHRSENAVKGLLRRARHAVLERFAGAPAPLEPGTESAHVESSLTHAVSSSRASH